MRIILCEDNANHREMLLSAFKAWAEANHCPDCEFTAYESAEELLAKEEKRSAADGFFLDLYLPGKNGFELAQMIRSKDPGVPIVFISSSGEYLRQGYEVSAYRYLIKPFSAADIDLCLNHCKTIFEGKTDRFFTVKQRGEMLRFRYSDTLFLAGEGHSIRIRTKDASVLVPLNESFSDFSGTFPSSLFVRCHQSFLVNLNAVTRFSSVELTLTSGERIPISRSYRQKTLEQVQGFFLGGKPE